ncbi:MAG TPA: MFS transporter [Kribbella sp.]|nr:MFS transporter [Kribbella sp.]
MAEQSTISAAPQELSRIRSGRGVVPHNVGFWLVAAAFASLQAFGTAPTPMWPLYAARDGLSATTVTIAFACMVVGAGASLYLFGHLSDRLGRRRIIVPALAFGIAAAAVMAWWPTLPGLLIGRVLTGVAVGLMASTATTYLTDLYREGHSGQSASRVPATVASVANLGGLSVGPLVAGALLSWVGHPFTTSYLVFILLMVIGAVSVSLSPETVDLSLPRSADAPKFVLRHAQRTVFIGAAAVAFCSFAIFGLFSSVGSLIVHGDLHEGSPVIWGLAGFVVLGVSALAQTLFPKLAVVRMLVLGLIGVPVGMALVVVALYNPSLSVYLLGSAIAGAGAGLLFKAALNVAITTAEPGSTAGVLALFFVVAYLGVGVPPVLLAAATHLISSRSALIVFSAVILAVSVIAARLQATALRR